MAIIPDTKDWTWVLSRPCPECGFDTSTFPREAVAGLLTVNASGWQDQLTGPGNPRTRPAPGTRPTPSTWSALEYGCHVRDVFRLYDYRLGLMLTQDDPLFPNWDQDATAVADHYAEQVPAEVAAELGVAAAALASSFDSVTGDQWHRKGRRSDGASFTVETFARYFIHDPIHHLYDVTGIQAGS